MDSNEIQIIRPGANIHLQESQYLAGEREAEIATLRNDPEFYDEAVDETIDQAIAAAVRAGSL